LKNWLTFANFLAEVTNSRSMPSPYPRVQSHHVVTQKVEKLNK